MVVATNMVFHALWRQLCLITSHHPDHRIKRRKRYMFDTDPDEAVLRISSPVGQTTIGQLEMIWTPWTGGAGAGSSSRRSSSHVIINDPSELIGARCRHRRRRPSVAAAAAATTTAAPRALRA